MQLMDSKPRTATSFMAQRKKGNATAKDLAQQFCVEIALRAERLPEQERKKRHAKLLEIANRTPKFDLHSEA